MKPAEITYYNEWQQLVHNEKRNLTNISKYLTNQMDKLRRNYAFAIPSWKALNVLMKYAPLLEIGAGTGYWAYLLKTLNVKIKAFDLHPIYPKHSNSYFKNSKSWTFIHKGDYNKIKQYSTHTLFLCWPPYNEPMAYDCLSIYKGKYFCYIGEEKGGCTGDEKFYKLLIKEWKMINKIEIPSWPWVHDSLTIWERKK